MTLDADTIRLGYQLILARHPSDAEIESGQKTFETLPAMRQAFLKSREFRRKYDRLAAEFAQAQHPTLVHLRIPAAEPEGLHDTLLAEEFLDPALSARPDTLEDLRQMTSAEQRALRYLHGDLDYGAGEALEGPHYYLTTLAEPGPRLHALWRAWGDGAGFGAFLQAGLDDIALRPEIDNGQIRRLAGDRSVESIGEEAALLRRALHNALGPRIFLGIAEAPQAVLAHLAENGLFAPGLPSVAPVTPHPDYTTDLAGLSPEERHLFDAFTAWDGYAYDICRQLPAPTGTPAS
ncbi:hypothetical protein FIU89_21845 (plasmid) [Roseovarius sp. THAF27]|uniref:hypothetical protein n=1 Tax=unclassified Roseovarius TaxID=2614913 RepID=UPI001267F48F|nr:MULTISPECIES: hypothetical protein [unclassified Roseovarius]QFT83280.1 hypothetical protein FIU89_21845 [Roseovarius sp. THAF27]QFT99958.1 hypothetical protein FIU85_21740 [Roseovarius sp. THAF8]